MSDGFWMSRSNPRYQLFLAIKSCDPIADATILVHLRWVSLLLNVQPPVEPIWTTGRDLCLLHSIQGIELAGAAQTSLKRVIPVADGTYMGPPAQLLVTRTSLLWMASITLFSARGPFPSFSLWHFSGLTDLHSEEVAGTKKFPVDWQVYAHYSDLFRPPVLHQGPASHRPGCDVEITSQEKWKDVESTEKRKQSRNESIGKW